MARITIKERRDLFALAQAHFLMWSVTLIIMLEDDVAMLAFMFS